MAGKQKSIFITGCSTGIGEETAKLFAEKGWVAFATVRKPADAERLRGLHPNIRPVILDVTDEEGVKKVFEEIRVAVGEDGLDGVVNNAGYGKIIPIEFSTLAEARKQFDVNVFGPVRVIQAAMPLLRIGEPGRIVNIGSLGSDQHLPIVGLYQGTKAALVTINECLRQEVARFGIKVVVIKPGPVETNFGDGINTASDDFLQRHPEGSDGYKYYGAIMQKVPAVMKKFEKMNVSAAFVAKRIYSVMTARNPRSIQCDTWGTYFQTLLVALTPVWIYDALLNATLLS